MKLFIAGHNGMVGGALVRRFETEQGVELLLRNRKELDLTSQAAVAAFYAAEKPDTVIMAAAKVGGILANNTYPADFAYDNLAIATNTIHGAFAAGVKRFLFLGSSCIYPKLAPQPMPEGSLLTGPLEPTNLYGPGDNYHLQNSHVMPALIRKFHEAKLGGKAEVVAWGTGSPKREFLHVDELADACAFLLRQANPPDLINIGTGTDVTIRELTEIVAEVVGFKGKITWDTTKPDGTPRKLMDVSRLTALGWKARIGVREGVAKTYASFLAEQAAGTLRS